MARVKLNMKGLNAIMRSRPVAAVVMREARRMAEAAGEGFEAKEVPHKWVARAYVQTTDQESRRRQSADAVLERVVTSR